jgi:hypothetical protein
LQLLSGQGTAAAAFIGSFTGLMDSTTDRRFTRTEIRLDEPHFDEEATLLSAQPVVPLEEVKAKTRSKARLSLALAIGGGLLIGLLAATLIYRYVGGWNQPQVLETTAVTEQPAAALENSAGGAIGRAETPALAGDIQPDSVVTEEPRMEPAPVKTEPAQPEIRQNAPKTRPVIIVRDEPEPVDDDDMDREARRAERQQEKRQRRAVREARRERAQTDDLLRIREIFEGSPRP